MKKGIIKLSVLLIFAFLFLQGCITDLHTGLVKKEGITTENVQNGKGQSTIS